jgi:hypothetical protein
LTRFFISVNNKNVFKPLKILNLFFGVHPVKKVLQCTLGLLLLSLSTLQADLEFDGTISRETLPNAEKDQPFKFRLNADAVNRARFDKSEFKHQHIEFDDFEAEARAVLYYNKACREGIYTKLGYFYNHIRWHENPFFNQSDFNTAYTAIGGFTERLCDWLWLAELTLNVDTDHFDLAEYSYYDLILWGRYKYSENIGVHVGLLVETGMRIDWVYPIIGFDWQPNESWKLNLIFPINVSAVYLIDECWSLALAGRIFQARHRVGKDQPLRKGLLTYQATGLELAVNFDCDSWLVLNLHSGYNLGGVFKVANRHYEHKHRFDFNGAGYLGGEIAVKF